MLPAGHEEVASGASVWRRATFGHYVLLLFSLASVVGWLMAPSEAYKLLFVIGTFFLCVVLVFAQFTAGFGGRPLVVAALLLGLASCSAQFYLTGADHRRVGTIFDAFTCEDGRRIFRSGEGFGRRWQATWSPDMRIARAPHPTHAVDLVLARYDRDGERYSLRTAGPESDTLFVSVNCRTGERRDFFSEMGVQRP